MTEDSSAIAASKRGSLVDVLQSFVALASERIVRTDWEQGSINGSPYVQFLLKEESLSD